MHPAFSVIFFTTLSGLGYGLWIWSGGGLLLGRGAHGSMMLLAPFALGVLPVAAGLLSSTLHLGKPLRAWRAFAAPVATQRKLPWCRRSLCWWLHRPSCSAHRRSWPAVFSVRRAWTTCAAQRQWRRRSWKP